MSETATPKLSPALFLYKVSRTFVQGESELNVLNETDFAIFPGEAVALVGPSGSGKSTLLQISGLLEHASAGEVYVGDAATSTLNDTQRTGLRRDRIGFVYQMHHLLPEFTAIENVMMPMLIKGLVHDEAYERSRQILAYLGLKDRLEHRPMELSGGEQQRVAIARAVANAPRLLLADEPTGNLDPVTAEQVFKLLLELVKATKVAALIATHDMALAARLDRRVTIRDGKVVELS